MFNVDRVEIFFYYMMGKYKWEIFGLKYLLEGIELFIKECVENVKWLFYIEEYIKYLMW